MVERSARVAEQDDGLGHASHGNRARGAQAADQLPEVFRAVPDPVPVRGLAKAGVLLADASGPLYHRASADDLRARVRDAADALVVA